jgi:outer membrane protein OmpA-like peptidoglycan-associated protein
MSKHKSGRLAAALCGAPLVLLFAVMPAAAQLRADRYGAPPLPEDLLWTERASAGGETLVPFIRLSATFADDPLVARDPATNDEYVVIDEQGGFHLSIGTALDVVQVYAQLPLFAQDPASLPADSTVNIARTETAGLGDLRVGARIALLARDPIELAFAADVVLPTGSKEAAASDGTVAVQPRVIVSRGLWARSFLSASAGVSLREAAGVDNLTLGSELLFSAGAFFDVLSGLGPVAELSGATILEEAFDDVHTPMEATMGARYASDEWTAQVGVGAGLTSGVGTPDVRVLAALGYRPAPGDEPETAAPVDGDADRDGVFDSKDKCPRDPEDRDGFEDDDGCPDADNDKDGIADVSDGCPLEAEDTDDFEDRNGCPEPDNDQDRLLDVDDDCPLEAEDKDGFEDADGCPEPDNDRDGILDPNDMCPLDAETANGKDDEDGCPDLIRVDREEGRIRILDKIHFATNSDRILERSFPLLDEMAKSLNTHPELGAISIEGHTDSKGSNESNRKLSQRRAASVLRFLAERGVPGERLSALGHGEDQPLETNTTEAGRAENRRVEFKLKDFVSADVDAAGAPAP